MQNVILTLSLLLSLIPVTAFSQREAKINGIVVDSLSQEAIRDAAITLQGSQSGTYTDAQGRFSLTGVYSGTYLVQVSHVGYHEKQVRLNVPTDGSAQVYIRLSKRRYSMRPVTIFSHRKESATITIDENEIRQSAAPSLEKLLEQYSGITVASGTGSGASGIRIRGSEINQVLVLLDGIPLNDPLTGEVNLDQVSLKSLEHISVVTHGASAKYGSGAFAGVVKLSTKAHQISRVSLSTGIGSFGEREINPGISGNTSDWNYTLNLRDRYSDRDFPYAYQQPNGTVIHTVRRNADLHLQSAQASLERNGKAGLFTLRTHYLHTDRGLPGKVYYWTPNARVKEQRYGFSSRYSHSFGHSSLAIRATYSHARSAYDNNPESPSVIVPEYHTTYTHSTTNGKIEYSVQPSEYFNWTIDFQGEQTGFEQDGAGTDFSKPIDARQQHLSGGGHVMYAFPVSNSDWRIGIKPAFRISYVRLFNRNQNSNYPFLSHSVTLNFSQKSSPGLKFYLQHNSSFRPPTFGDLFYQDFRVSGNPDLLPEKSREFDAGFSIGVPQLFSSDFRVEIFSKKVDDQIIWVMGSYANFTPKNTNARISGQSIQWQWNTQNRMLSGQFSADHLVAINRNTNPATRDKILPNRPEWQGHASLKLRVDPFSFEYNQQFRGYQYITEANTKSLDGYTAGNFSARFQWDPGGFWKNLTIEPAVDVFNLWDERYQVVSRMPEPGRSFYFSIKLEYQPKQLVEKIR